MIMFDEVPRTAEEQWGSSKYSGTSFFLLGIQIKCGTSGTGMGTMECEIL